MPSLANSVQTALLQLLFNATPWMGVAYPAIAPTPLYIALHDANPGPSGVQSTNETVYSGYARVAMPRSAGSWTVSQNDPAQVQNIQAITFPLCTGTGDTATFWSIGWSATGPGSLLVSGPIGNSAVYGFAATAGAPCSLYIPQLPAGLLVNSLVALYQFGPGMLLPQGLVEGEVYYVGTVSEQNVTLSTLPNNAAPVTASIAGSGLLLPVTPIVVVQNVAPTFPPNSLFVFLD